MHGVKVTTEEAEWMMVAKRRLAELRSGRVEAVPGDEVFARIRDRFERDPSGESVFKIDPLK
jgi:hypothetical protein